MANRQDLIAAAAEESGLTKAAVEQSLQALLAAISNSLASGEDVTLVGFGTFSVKNAPERTGRNPQTGAEITIAASKKISFKTGKALKDLVNG